MKSNRIYALVLVVTLLALTALLFIGPLGEEDRSNAYLWQQDWERIEYRQLSDSDEKQSVTDPQKLIRFLREPGLKADRYYVDAPYSENHTSPVKREANSNAANLFRDWRKPKHKGFYEPTAERIRLAGLENPQASIQLFGDLEGTEAAATIRIGKKQQNGNYIAEVTEQGGKPVLAVIPAFMVQKLQYGLDHYRQKRFIYFAAQSSLEQIQIRFNESDGKGVSLKLIRRERESEPSQSDKGSVKQPDFRWYNIDANDSAEPQALSEHLMLQLEGRVKQIQIKEFADHKDLQPYRSAQPSKNDMRETALELKITLSDGSNYHAWLKAPSIEGGIQKEDVSLAWFYDEKTGFTDFVELRLYQDLLKLARQIASKPNPVKQKNSVEPDAHSGHLH